ncbi:glycoside hydrolase [Christiangramia fulva]|uniref:Glycoside hydrolase n=1 Tax=Christiangramia fulva TaxID=2126553 RepID=A0A2R3Z5U9_9FLAO|nr:glycoside hydrolase family 28 protein [Christiangramia fulva]AVR45657.1 glycoside hydrolase [Christiangramia fulva]
MKPFSFSIIIIALVAVFSSCKDQDSRIAAKDTVVAKDSIWQRADEIVQNIAIPSFPDKTFNITDFGAKAGGEVDNTEAFRKAIAECVAQGGGMVLVPQGKFLTGPIHLKSNVNLHLQEGAEVLFTTDKDAYLPVVHSSYEGVELMNYSPLIYAYGEKNVAVTGKGIFNGQADNKNWWPWAGKDTYGHKDGEPSQNDENNLPTLRNMNEKGVPVSDRVFGKGHQIRPSFFEAFECENVLVKGVTFTNAPFWILHPIKSENVTIDGVTVNSHGPNNDGCDPEYSKYVHITNCVFNTGDDCIAIKSGRNEDGRRVAIPSENIVIENCIMKDGHGGVVIGSEISAGVLNVFVRNCKMNSPELERAIRIKTNTKRGGTIRNIYVKNLEVGEVKEAVLKINTHYGIYDNQEGEFMPVIRNIRLEDVNVEKGGKFGILITGREESPVKGVSLKNVTIKGAETPVSIEHSEPIKYENTTINGKKY